MNYQNVNVKTAKQGVQNKMKSLSKNHSSILKVPFPSSINLFGNISVPNPQLTNPRLIYLQDLSFFLRASDYVVTSFYIISRYTKNA